MNRNIERTQISEPLLQAHEVSLAFGGVQALSNVSFSVEENELFAIIGPNGAGKSSLFNCISSLYRPQQGWIELGGHNLVNKEPRFAVNLGLGRMFQNLGLFNDADVETNLMLGRHSLMRSGFLSAALWFGRTRQEELLHRVRVQELIDLLGLRTEQDQRVGTLPYGTRKLIELGRALAMEPRVLLMDEPVAGMNLEERERMAETIQLVRRTLGTTILLVEHDIGFVMDLADRVMVLDFGKVIQLGSPEVVRNDPRVIEAYLGASHSKGEIS